MTAYIIVDGIRFPINDLREIAIAKDAMRDSGLTECRVYLSGLPFHKLEEHDCDAESEQTSQYVRTYSRVSFGA